MKYSQTEVNLQPLVQRMFRNLLISSLVYNGILNLVCFQRFMDVKNKPVRKETRPMVNIRQIFRAIIFGWTSFDGTRACKSVRLCSKCIKMKLKYMPTL